MKRNANAVAAILENFEIAEEALAVATQSAGSALNENEIFLDSIQGKLNQFSAAWQVLSETVVNSGLVKGIVDFGTALLNTLNSISNFSGGIGTLLTMVPLSIAAYQKFGKVKNVVDAVAGSFKPLVGGAK